MSDKLEESVDNEGLAVCEGFAENESLAADEGFAEHDCNW